jgi:hypothetical protein
MAKDWSLTRFCDLGIRMFDFGFRQTPVILSDSEGASSISRAALQGEEDALFVSMTVSLQAY